mmetsp:Transcript_33690/g.81670  ORF Transcript_33690/g.81670 Transcript_33690/m.81670 type:complete len:474 (-) Transcript_33690:139-1560(-)
MRISDKSRNKMRQIRERKSTDFRCFSDNSHNGFRLLCLLTLCQVVLSAYHSRNTYKTTTTKPFAHGSSTDAHSPFNTALHVSSFTDETLDSAAAAVSQSATRPPQDTTTTIESTGGGQETANFNPLLNTIIPSFPEWNSLSDSAKTELQQILDWKTVSTFDYPEIFRLDELSQGHSLLFMSWAILASPHSQPVLSSSQSHEQQQEQQDTDYCTLLNQFGISSTKFLAYVRRIEQGYKDNPFHNHIHAADVLQTLHSMLQSENGFRSKLTGLEHLSILLAAISHDVGHDGTNNEFQVQQQSPIAVQYQNVSVLENYHAEVGLRELEASGMIKHMPLEQQEEIRSRISQAILHTDMSKHQDQVKAYQKMNDWEQAMYFLHLCDLSNPTKSTFFVWTDHVLEEFYQTGDLQKSLGFPVMPTINDRTTSDKVSIQRGFIQFMVLPAFEAVEFSNPKIMERLYANFDYWMQQEVPSKQ